jgi:hypothetical protein
VFFFSAKSGAFVVRVFLVEGLSRSLKFFLMSLFLSLSFSLSSVASFFLSFSCCLFCPVTQEKKNQNSREEKVLLLSVCANKYWNIFSTVLVSLSSGRWWCRA